MTTNRILRILICLVATALAAGALTASAPAQGRPAGMSQQAYAALMARSDALNKLYHLGKYATVPAGMSIEAYQALKTRSDALNKLYHLGKYARPAPSPPVATTGTGFDWTNVAIGAVAALGLAVLVGAGAVARTRWHPRARPSH